jgi:hypothetical protein
MFSPRIPATGCRFNHLAGETGFRLPWSVLPMADAQSGINFIPTTSSGAKGALVYARDGFDEN